MTSYFQNGAKNSFLKTGIYFILYPTIYQNMKTELKNLFLFRRDCFSKLIGFYRFFSNVIPVMESPLVIPFTALTLFRLGWGLFEKEAQRAEGLPGYPGY